MDKGLNLPNRQWDPYTNAELAALDELEPGALVFLAYGSSIDVLHAEQLVPYLTAHRSTRVLVRCFDTTIGNRTPNVWAEECWNRLHVLGYPGNFFVPVELIPWNEPNVEWTGHETDWTFQTRFAQEFRSAWGTIARSIPLHLPALSPTSGYRDGFSRYVGSGLTNIFDVVDVHCYPGSVNDWQSVASMVHPKPVSITEFNGIDPGQFFTSAQPGAREACWFLLGGTDDQAAYDLLRQPLYYQSFKAWRPNVSTPPPTPAPTILAAAGYPAVDRVKIFEYATWSMARIHNNEDPRDVGAYLQHLRDLGADPTRAVDYGLPYELTLPKA